MLRGSEKVTLSKVEPRSGWAGRAKESALMWSLKGKSTMCIENVFNPIFLARHSADSMI